MDLSIKNVNQKDYFGFFYLPNFCAVFSISFLFKINNSLPYQDLNRGFSFKQAAMQTSVKASA